MKKEVKYHEKVQKNKTHPVITRYQEKSNILTTFVFTVCIGIILRIFFITTNVDSYHTLEFVKSLLLGILIDSVTLSILFIPSSIYFLFIQSSFKKWIQYGVSLYLNSVVSLFILLSIIDIFFFQIYQDRLHVYALKQALEVPLLSVVFMIHNEYPYGFLFIPLVIVLSWILSRWQIDVNKIYRIISYSPQRKQSFQIKNKVFQKLFLFHFCFFIAISVCINPKNLFLLTYQVSEKFPLMVSSRNALFNVTSHFFMPFKMIPYFTAKKKDLLKLINESAFNLTEDHWSLQARHFKNPQKHLQTKPHIVLINVDSLSPHFMGHIAKPSLMPFLDNMANKGLLFTNFYYHWLSSFNSYISLLLGFPAIDSDILYNAQHKTKTSLMDLLKTQGYKSFFVQGASLANYSLGVFLKNHGIHKAIGSDTFFGSSSSKSHTNSIPVNDKEVVDKAYDKIKQWYNKQPVFMTVALNTLHLGDNDVLKMPDSCPIFKQSPHSIKLQERLCYLNWVIEDFVTRLSSLINNNNFIVVLTGEHRSWTPSIDYTSNTLQHYQVPLIILDQRGMTPKGINNKVASHADVATTLLYMMGYEGSYPFIGQNLLDQENVGTTIFSDTHFFYYLRGEYLLERHRRLKQFQIFKITDRQIKEPILDTNIRKEIDEHFKTYMVSLKLWLDRKQVPQNIIGGKQNDENTSRDF